jgi:hypothetical protein
METTTSALLLFKDAKYRVSALLGLLKQAPVIEVKRDDINPITVLLPENAKFKVQLEPDTPELKLGEVVFFKQEGKYTVLMGQTKAQRALQDGQAILKGRLVTSVGMKKALVVDIVRETLRASDQPTAIQQAFAKQIERKASDARTHSPRSDDRPARPPHKRPAPFNATVTRRGFASRNGSGQ